MYIQYRSESLSAMKTNIPAFVTLGINQLFVEIFA